MSGITAQKKKITADIPATLNERVETVVHERQTTFSVVVREALEKYVREFERLKLEEDLREGCMANAELDRRICQEFESIDSEVTV